MPNLLIQPAPVPSIGSAARNAIAMRNQQIAGDTAQVQLQGAKTMNMLAEKQLGSYDEDRKAQAEKTHLETQARAITAALNSPDPDQATQIFKSLGGDQSANFKFEGEDVVIDYPTHTLKGPRAVVGKMMEVTGENGIVGKDPAMWKWFAENGGSMTKKDPKKKDERYKVVGGRLVDISGDEPKIVVDSIDKETPETLLDKGLVKVGNDLIDVSDPKHPKPVYQAEDKSKEPSKEKALKRISDIQKAKATLEKTDTVTQLMTLLNPRLAGKEGQKIDDNTKAALMDAWENELDYLEQFSGTTRKKEPAPKPPGGGATHTFIPGQGIVPNQ